MTDPNDQQPPHPGPNPAADPATNSATDPATGPAPQQGAGDEREWIPVAPPNPYAAATRPAAGGAGGGGAPGASKGLAISAMAFGLVALLTTVVAAFYWNPLVALGAGFGIAATVLGIIALVKRSRPLGGGIAGLVAGMLAVFIAVGAGALALGAYLAPDGAPSADGGSSSWEPDQEPETLLEWPANMATGGVVFEQGPGGPAVRESDPVPAGNAPAVSAVDREGDVADIMLYVDFRCPHCMDFETANGALLTELVDSGDATIEIVPMSFVDRNYSAPLAGALACVVDGQPEAGWAAYTALFGPELRASEPTLDTVLPVLETATGGLDPSVADCIGTGRFVPFVQALNVWASSNPVPNALDPALGVTGTPLAVVNGVPFTGAPSDGDAFAQFIGEQLR